MIFTIALTFNFEIIVDYHTIVRSNLESPGKPFVQYPPVVTFCRTIVQYHNQDID